MSPEEFYYLDYIARLRERDLRTIRINSLEWVLNSYRKGKVRKETIVGLIPLYSLESLLSELVMEEQYEICAVIRDLIKECYERSTY